MKTYTEMTREELTGALDGCRAVLSSTRSRIRLGMQAALASGIRMDDVLDFYGPDAEEVAAVRKERKAILAELKTR